MKFLDDIGFSYFIDKMKILLNKKADKTELHNHLNKSTLDKFADVGGKPTYNGKNIGGISTIATSTAKVVLSIDSNTVNIPIVNFNKDRDSLMVYKNSVFEDEYTINAGGTQLLKNYGIWPAGTIFNLVAWQPLAVDGVEGVVLEQEKTTISITKPIDGTTMWYEEII